MHASIRFVLVLAFVSTASLFLASGCGQDEPGITGPAGPEFTTSAGKSKEAPQYYSLHWPPPYYAPTLMRIDTQTGAGIPLAALDIYPFPGAPDAFLTPYGLAFDADGALYSIHNSFDGIREHSFSQLIRIDLESGAVTPIGPIHDINFAGPEMSPCGDLYATGFEVGPPHTGGVPTIVFGDSYLYRFDKHTGEKVRVGDTGKTNWMDLDFDSQGRLWATTENKLFLLDTMTGASTFVTDIHGVPTSDIPGVCPEDAPFMEVMSIAFDHEGVLWATAMTGFSICEGYSPVMRIDVETGMATVIGNTGLQSWSHGGDIMPSKVKVCHRAGNKGKVVPVEIALMDLAHHRAHGDMVPGVDFEGCNCPGDDTGRPGDGLAGD